MEKKPLRERVDLQSFTADVVSGIYSIADLKRRYSLSREDVDHLIDSLNLLAGRPEHTPAPATSIPA